MPMAGRMVRGRAQELVLVDGAVPCALRPQTQRLAMQGVRERDLDEANGNRGSVVRGGMHEGRSYLYPLA